MSVFSQRSASIPAYTPSGSYSTLPVDEMPALSLLTWLWFLPDEESKVASKCEKSSKQSTPPIVTDDFFNSGLFPGQDDIFFTEILAPQSYMSDKHRVLVGNGLSVERQIELLKKVEELEGQVQALKQGKPIKEETTTKFLQVSGQKSPYPLRKAGSSGGEIKLRGRR
mmetsp:Transcript_28220/g.31345  ORF Transcript_28220/g.31345 Transcript_28220/m.31345 type:complete len:168 (+) Transcript_28220:183-686(+)|eukprot:CAMPEP_0168528864 /NCGR_PEP_ID=MMETSP0405-20121227/13526_1 /TAXON_ID=498012 /ORGANISM="Trichosphaerium sp, Strain Am-I-7 wt" /LENGTH=167 /DNA_ID=CAMNT_0008552397 /DNA_START=154 /DNA_END=657 /DNA_ORIENTATION=-